MKDYSVQLTALIVATVTVKVQGENAFDAISNALLTTSTNVDDWDLVYLDRSTIEGNAMPYHANDPDITDEDFGITSPLMSLYPTKLEEF
jgi:hypothetical protein